MIYEWIEGPFTGPSYNKYICIETGLTIKFNGMIFYNKEYIGRHPITSKTKKDCWCKSTKTLEQLKLEYL